jgi:hypothetical protein
MLDSHKCVSRKPASASTNFAIPGFLALLGAALLAACGTGTGDDGLSLAERGDGPARLTTQTCAATLITKDACSGPWDYHQYNNPCYAQRAAAPCPIDGAPQTCFPACMHNYQAPFNYTYTYPPVETCTFVKVCEPCTAARPQPGQAVPNAPICRQTCTTEEVCTTKCDTGNIDGLPAVAAANGWLNPTFTIVGGTACKGTISVQQHQNSPDPSCGAGFDCSAHVACRDPSFGLDPNPKACGASEVFSLPNLTEPLLVGGDPHIAKDDPNFANPVCTTCDQIATDSDLNTQKKAQCLLDNLAKYVNGTGLPPLPADFGKAVLETNLVSNLKALYEAAGSRLTFDQQDSILALYTSKPTEKYPCSGWTAPALPAGCTANPQADGAMDLCARIDTVPTDPALLAKYTDSCLGGASQIAAVPPNCNAASYRADYNTATFDLLAKTQQQIQVSPTRALSVPDLQIHLGRIQQWYSGYRLQNPASAGPAANAAAATGTSIVLGTFWSAVNSKIGVPLPGTIFGTLPGQTSPDVVFNLFQTAVEANRSVLTAALTNVARSTKPPITSAPLVELLGDSLKSLSDRLDQVGLYQDLGCRFRADSGAVATPSCRNGQLRTEIAELTRLLASLDDPAALHSTLAADIPTAFPTGTWANWRTMFSNWDAGSSVVQTAVLDAFPGITTYRPDLLVPGATGPLPGNPFTAGLARIIQNARARISSFDATGLFDSSAQGVLHAGIQQERVNDVVLTAQQRSADLTAQITTYDGGRITLANSITEQMKNAGTQANISNEIRTRIATDQQLSQDVAGLRNMIEIEEARYADFVGEYDKLLKFNTDSNTSIMHLPFSVKVAPADAHWPSATTVMTPGTPLTSFATSATPVVPAAHAGDVLHITTTGSWLPTCALTSASPFGSIQMPDGFAPTISIASTATVGPEGFLLQVGTSAFTATGNSKVHETTQYTNTDSVNKACAGGDFGSEIQFTTIQDSAQKGKAHSEFCKLVDTGTSVRDPVSNSTSDGSETRFTANFTTGLRLPGTPFPTFPTGSLLLIQAKHHDPAAPATYADIVDIQVLQEPSSGIVIGNYTDPVEIDPATGKHRVYTAFDIYLAVNDIHCAPTDSRALAVDIVQTEPVNGPGNIAVHLGKGMAVSLDRLRNRVPALLEQGRIGPEQMSQLRAQGFDDLRTACVDDPTQPPTNCALSFYPPELQTFFSSWISKELANLERKADLRSDLRQLDIHALEAKQLADDLNNAQDQARLLQLEPGWILEDLGTHLLQEKTRKLLNQMIGEVYPIVDLRAPLTLNSDSLDTESLAELVGLGSFTQLDWTSDLADWSTVAASLSNNIAQTVHDTLFSQSLTDTIIAVGFPNPDYPLPLAGSWNRVSPERAAAVWTSINDPAQTFFSVHLLPSDIWRPLGGTDVLACSTVTPVITAMEVYMVRPSMVDGYGGRSLPMQIDGNLEFPSPSVDKIYRLDNAEWLGQQIAVRSNPQALVGDDALQQDAAALMGDNVGLPYRVGNGLSPFTTFDIGTGALSQSLAGEVPPAVGASELVLIFRVQARNGAALNLAPMCP